MLQLLNHKINLWRLHLPLQLERIDHHILIPLLDHPGRRTRVFRFLYNFCLHLRLLLLLNIRIRKTDLCHIVSEHGGGVFLGIIIPGREKSVPVPDCRRHVKLSSVGHDHGVDLGLEVDEVVKVLVFEQC